MYTRTTKLDFFKTSIYKKLNNRISESVFKSVSDGKIFKNQFIPKVLSIFISLIFSSLFVIPIYFGIVILKGDINFFTIIFSLLLFIAGISLFPWPYKFKDKKQTRKDLPHLFQLTDSISNQLEVKKVDYIVLENSVNAYISKNHFTGKITLGIGVPLFIILNEDEKVALISHELSHLKYNDNLISQIYFLGTQSLLNMASMFYIFYDVNLTEHPVLSLVYPLKFIFYLFRKVIHFLYYILLHLKWINSQADEFYADLNGATISGTSAFVGLLTKLYSESDINIISKEYITHKNDQCYIDFLTKKFNENFSYRVERYRKSIEEKDELISSHPPTKLRISFLNQTNNIKKQAFYIKANNHELIMNEIRDIFRFRSYT